tara:strand:- start:999 stop:2036 length:1038 start_codon:yes stop_codon:yes gene_type:complete
MTKVLFIDNGIEFDSKLLREKPFGGAEVAFVSLVESLACLGLEIVVYNNCIYEGKINNVEWRKIGKKLHLESFDSLVVNRGDKYLNFRKECKNRIFWIHNPASYLLKYRYISKLFFNDFKIVFSSNYHLSTYPKWAPSQERIVIPYGMDDYLFSKNKIKRIPSKNAIFTSNPMRGLDWLLEKWEKQIYPKCKDSKLIIFSGSETYGSFGRKHSDQINNILLKAKSLKKKGVILKNPVNRKKLFKNIESSRVFLYKGSQDETFCMALAESQLLGVPAVVCDFGCMNERVIDNKTGFVCKNDDDFCSKTIDLLNNDKLWIKMNKESLKRENYFNWNEIAKKWLRILN